MAKIILKGNPISTNTLYKSVCRGGFPSVYMTNKGKSLKEEYQWQAKSQWKFKPLEDEVGLYVKLFFGNKRNNDIDNFNKILFDSLTGIVWKDDSQITKLTIEKLYDKDNPRIEISV